MPYTVFIADMHFSRATGALNRLFAQQLAQWKDAGALYLLGDIFDAWIGDDGADAAAQQIIAQMAEFSRVVPLFVMRGNRDFLLGGDFARQSGATLLEDPYLLDLYGKKYILTHGDIMCTDDLAYQRFRAKSRDPAWQARMLRRPLWVRRTVAAAIRTVSQTKKKQAAQYRISDVTPAGIAAMQQNFAALPDVPDIIHGHTHRPAVHSEHFRGRPFSRFVLPDWRGSSGGALVVAAGQTPQMITFRAA